MTTHIRNLLPQLILLLGAVPAATLADTIDFENQCPSGQQSSGPCSALFSTVGNAQTLTIATNLGSVMVVGGALFNDITNLPSDETSVYGTAGNSANIGVFPGAGFTDPLTVIFPKLITSFSLDVLNGNTMTVDYRLADNLGNTADFALAPNLSGGLKTIGFAAAGNMVTIAAATGQSTASGTTWDFLIDNINFTAQSTQQTAAPEPAALYLFGAGLVCLGLSRCGRKSGGKGTQLLILAAAMLSGLNSSAATTGPGPIALACPTANGMAGTPYTSMLAASGGVPPYTISITSGALPSGLILNASTGVITGTPSSLGTATFTGRVVDSLIAGAGGSPDSTTVNCSILIAPMPVQAGPIFTGNAPSVSGSVGTLTLSLNFPTDKEFQWQSNDSVLGTLNTGGFIMADTWTYTPATTTTPDRLLFRGHIGNIVFQGGLVFGNYLNGTVDVIRQGAQTIRYVLNMNRVVRITATIQPTPCQTVRAEGQNRPGPVNFQSTQATQNFNTPTTLVILQGSTRTIALTATKSQPQGNILYFVQRAADDNPAIGGANNLPTLTPNGADAANLGTDQAGSFSIGAYVDVNNNGKRDFFEPPTYLNYVLAGLLGDAAINNGRPVVDSVQPHQTITIARAPNDPATWNRMVVDSGNFNIATPNDSAIYLNATVDMVGGGPDGRRGLDRVFGGWVNNELPEGIRGSYTNNHFFITVFASNRPASRIFTPGGAVPALVEPPLLDVGPARNPPGTGGDTATLSRSRIRSRTDLARGSRIAIDAVDSPGQSYRRFDPGFPASTLRAADFGLTFNAYLALWSNVTAAIGATGDAADRLYSVGLIAPWNMRGSWAISATGVATGAAPSVGSVGRTAQQNALLQATATRMEVCAPTALNLLAIDARN